MHSAWQQVCKEAVFLETRFYSQSWKPIFCFKKISGFYPVWLFLSTLSLFDLVESFSNRESLLFQIAVWVWIAYEVSPKWFSLLLSEGCWPEIILRQVEKNYENFASNILANYNCLQTPRQTFVQKIFKFIWKWQIWLISFVNPVIFRKKNITSHLKLVGNQTASK